MIWEQKRKFWRRWFAVLPIILNNGPKRTIIWWQWVWLCDKSLYIEVSLTDPEATELGPGP